MIKYTISCPNPLNHILHITLEFEPDMADTVSQVWLPVWRPGRYELANYAKNVLAVTATNEAGEPLPVDKISKSKWEVKTGNAEKVCVHYRYYAFQMDAGNSWVHDDLIYLNFINCLLYLPSRMHEEVELQLDVPAGYKVATSLTRSDNVFRAGSYYEIADSPLMAGRLLRRLTYEVAGTSFHIWINGPLDITDDRLLADFAKFSKAQCALFGGLPARDYHFLLLFLHRPFYHGVEHANSTVIVLGPGTGDTAETLYEKLLGISSHELFHAWNVTRIRPAELLPYDFSSEVYFDTGFVAEGFTTYYGDLMLARAGVYGTDWYLKELNQLLKRHYLNFGRLNLPLTASSTDLWLDGYSSGVPGRKSSIYVEGAVSALLLDLTIRLRSDGSKSLDDVMRILWNNYYKNGIGYRKADIVSIAGELCGESVEAFFRSYIDGTEPTENALTVLLPEFGLRLARKWPEDTLERLLGFSLRSEKDRQLISQIDPESQASACLSLDDELLAVDGQPLASYLQSTPPKEQYGLLIKRGSRELSIRLNAGGPCLGWYELEQAEETTSQQQQRFRTWLGPYA